jgi:hypothetical protein
VNTVQVALILFVVTALGGITMAVLRIKRVQNPPIALVVLHGLAGGSAIAALGIAVLREGVAGLARAALAVFGLAVLGGATLFTMHMRGRLLPVPFIFAHGTIAATGLVLLLLHVLR